MAEEKETNDYEAQIATLQAQLAEREEQSSDPDNYEIRFNKAKEKQNAYAQQLVERDAEIERLNNEHKAKEEERHMKAGNTVEVINSQKDTIGKLESRLAQSELNVERLMIGRELGLPDTIARLLPGDDIAEIKVSAEKVVSSLPKGSKRTDATGAAPSVPKNASQTKVKVVTPSI